MEIFLLLKKYISGEAPDHQDCIGAYSSLEDAIMHRAVANEILNLRPKEEDYPNNDDYMNVSFDWERSNQGLINVQSVFIQTIHVGNDIETGVING